MRIAATKPAALTWQHGLERHSELPETPELGPLSGEELHKLVAEVSDVSAGTVELLRGIYTVK